MIRDKVSPQLEEPPAPAPSPMVRPDDDRLVRLAELMSLAADTNPDKVP